MLRNSPLGKHAVVLGGGMAGLLAARFLTEHFERVSLIERDHYPEDPVFRPGVPQGRHVHVLHVRGLQIIEELFPGIQQDFVASGAIEGDIMKDHRLHHAFGWFPRISSRLRVYTMTRFLLEWQVRQALAKKPQIHIIDGHEVVNVIASEDAKSIIGVSLQARPHLGGQEPRKGDVGKGLTSVRGASPLPTALSQVAADLVVDATGRDSKAPHWLKLLGYAPPPETIVNPFLGYASQLCALPADPQRDWNGMLISANPPGNLRTGMIWLTEEGHWIVQLAGTGKDYPPNDTTAFLDFGRGLSDLSWFEAVKGAQPLSPIYGYRKTENRLRHFERLRRQPERLLVMGDAACAFNPVYAQGMTVAALGAMELRECLRQCGSSDLSGLAHRFQCKLARINASPWTLATVADMRVPAVEGGSMKWTTKLMARYLDRLTQQATTDPSTASLFVHVIHMVESSTALFKPSIVMKVIFTRRRA